MTPKHIVQMGNKGQFEIKTAIYNIPLQTRTPTRKLSREVEQVKTYKHTHAYLHGVNKLSINIEGCSTVFQHAFAHHQNQMMPLTLNYKLSTPKAGTTWENLIKRGFFTKIINWNKEGKEKTQHPHSTIIHI